MTEVIISIAAKVAEYLVEPTIQHGQYLFCRAKIKRNFESEKDKLRSAQESVQKRVEEAHRRTDTIDNAVDKWLNEVESLMQDVEKLEEKMKENKGHFGGWCPTWSSYQVCNQMAKKRETMVQLNASHEFNPFSHPTQIHLEYSSENFMYFESTILASNQLLEALGGSNCDMIGLCGMGGSGKTTLAKEVAKKAKESKLVDHFVLTTVSQTPNVKKMQGEIADFLGLTFREETEFGRAERIALRLQSGERILVILDDVWKKLSLEDIGIRLSGNQNRCKVLLTTRLHRVCTLMGCKKKIPLQLLSKNEAWTLFNKHACINDVTLQAMAQDVVEECKGLPIALVALGSCIKEKDHYDIKVVLHRLRHAKPVDVDEGDKDAFKCLRLSYDYLKNKEAKLLFFMCAMFPEDHRINPEDLLRYGIGLDVCGEVDSFEIARSQVNAAIKILTDSSLLMQEKNINGDPCLRMHDMVRDVALWIASQENRTIMVNHETRLNKTLKDCYALSWWCKDIDLPQQLDAPKLEMLLVNSEQKYFDLSYASFECFKGIKVIVIETSLFMARNEATLLCSTQLLTNLRTLRLVGRKLDDISFVVSLRSLEILDFQRSILKELPNGLENLSKLKLMDLSKCQIGGQCYEIIKRCLQLEELYVHQENGRFWRGSNGFIDSNTFCLEDVTFSKLQRYQLEVGNIRASYNVGLCFKSLYIEGLNISTSGVNIKDLLQRATKIGLIRLKGGCKNVMPKLVQAVGGMNELIELYLDSCSEIECVLNTTSVMGTSFEVDNVVQTLLLLQKLEIENCAELKYIMKNGACGNNTRKRIDAVPGNFPLYFSQLKKLYIHNCHKLEYTFPISVVQRLEQLEEISISRAPNLKYIFGEPGHEYHSLHQNEIQILLPHLKVIKLLDLQSLVKIFRKSCNLINWPSLTEFSCEYCPKLMSDWTGSTENMGSSEQRQPHSNTGLEANGTNSSKLSNEVLAVSLSPADFDGRAMDLCFSPEIVNPIASRLTKLELGGLPELRHIWMGTAHLLSLECLEKLYVYNCGKLKSLISVVVQRSLPHLTRLSISRCEELEEIIAENEDSYNLSYDQVRFPKLKSLIVEGCRKLKSLFSMAMVRIIPQLEELIISDCAQIKEIFGHENIEDSNINNRKEIVLPNLRRLSLRRLPSLVDICQGFTIHAVELFSVAIDGCPNFNLFSRPNEISSVEVIKDGDVPREIQALQTILNVKMQLAVPVTEEQGPFTLSNLESLTLQNLPDMMFIWKGPTLISFQLLRRLTVEGCRKLRCIFSAAVIRSLPQLCRLKIKECEELEEIISEEEAHFPNPSTSHLRQPCFPKLISLQVGGCNRLRCVFTVFISPNLPCLQYLEITKCSQLEQVFGCAPQKHNATMMEFELPNLSELRLCQLPSLVDICQGFTFRAVKLAVVRIDECPKFDPFLRANQAISADQTKEATRDGDVPPKIQALQTILNVKMQHPVNEEQGPIMLSNLESLTLQNLPDMVFIWKGPTLISFQLLRWLTVQGCRKLRCIFSAAVTRSLPQLHDLIIKECEELEEIILEEEAHLPNQSTSHPQQPCFPKLEYLFVEGCNRLRYVFPVSISPNFPCLSYLEIRRCSQLEKVFGSAPENHDAAMVEFELPKLFSFTLEELPRLTYFWRGFESQLEWEALKRCRVKDCPNFPSTTSATSSDTEENKEEEKEKSIDENVGDTFGNIEDINDEDEDVNDDKENNKVEDGAEDDEDEHIDLTGFLDNNN